ncbi:MAG: zf-HC2 domain-containing protein [Candidatus Rokuibacteriota bacterium]
MTCHDAREQFSALVDEALDAEARASLDAHLGGCAECRRELEAFRRTVTLVRGIEPARAPVGFVDRVITAARPEPWSRRLARRLFLPWPVRVPLEAAAVVIVGVLAVWLFQRMPEQRQFARTDAPIPVTSGREPASQAAPGSQTAPASQPAPASPAAAAREKKAARPTEPAGPRPDAEAPKAPADKRESADALKAAPRPEEARGQIAREGFRDQPAAAEPRAVEKSQRQSTAKERDQDAAVDRLPGVAPSPPPSQVAGRLTSPDRERAERELRALAAKHGGTTVWRRGDGNVTLVDMEIPRDKYAQFVAEVMRLGRFTVDREAPTLPETIRVQVQLE